MSEARPDSSPTVAPIDHLAAPLVVNWSLSYRCNFDCRHCYTRLDRSPDLDLADLRAMAERFEKAGVRFVNFGGGEPLLVGILHDLARHASGLGLQVSMNSNGSLIDAAAAHGLREAGFSSVGLSIDSHLPAVHDAFRNHPGSHALALAAAGHLRAAGLTITVSSVISQLNFRELEGLIEMAAGVGATRLYLHNFKCSGKGLENRFELDLDPGEWREFYSRAIQLAHGAPPIPLSFDDPIMFSLEGAEPGAIHGSTCGKLSLHVRPNGDITPCGFIPLVIGNALRDDILTLWETSPVLLKMRRKEPQGKCRACPSFELCLGGCTARAYALTGDMEQPDPHCWRP